MVRRAIIVGLFHAELAVCEETAEDVIHTLDARSPLAVMYRLLEQYEDRVYVLVSDPNHIPEPAQAANDFGIAAE